MSIAAALRNPILERELLTLLRSRKAFLLLAGYLLLSIALVLVAWPRESSTLLRQGAISRQIFSSFATGQTYLLALILPAVLGAAMTSEKEGRTLDLLLTTPLSASAILFGKLLSGTAYFVALAASTLPVVLLCSILGGLSRGDIIGLYVFLLVQVALYGLTSILLSSLLDRTYTAVIASYVFVAAEAAVLGAVFGDGLGLLAPERLTPLLVASGGGAFVLFLATRAVIRRPHSPVQRALEEEDPTRTRGLVIRRDVYPDKLIAPARRSTPMDDHMNPVLEKELQAEIYGSGSFFIRMVVQLGGIASVVVLLATIPQIASGGANRFQVEYPYFCFVVAYIMVLGPALGARAFTYEKEEETIEQLLLTLVPRRRIVTGKFLAFARVIGALTLINCVSYFPLILFSSSIPTSIAALLLVVGATTTLTTALGLFLSLWCRTTLAAMITTYFVLFAIYMGPVLASPIVEVLVRGRARQGLESALSLVSPLLAGRLPPGGNPALLANLGLHAAASVAVAVALLAIMAIRFERIIIREAEGRS